jgi:DNA-binding beta-propeller fold protein YncE
MGRSRGLALVVAAFLGSSSAARAEPAAPLTLVRTILLGGVEGRIDHLAVDAKEQRLALAALANDSLEVLDLEKGEVAKHVPGLPEPQGVAWLADDRIVVSCGGDGTVRTFDGATYKPAASVDVGDDADNVRIEAGGKTRWFVGAGDGAIAAIDAEGRVSRVALEAHPESFQLEAKGSRTFVNVPRAKHVAVIDREKGAVIARWPNREAQDNFPMALDEESGRLFVGCRTPSRLVVLDTTSGATVGACECSGDVDDVWVDSSRKRLYLSCGEGFVDVFDLSPDGAKWSRTSRVPTAAGARTSLYVPSSGRLYVAVPHRGSQSASVLVFSTR